MFPLMYSFIDVMLKKNVAFEFVGLKKKKFEFQNILKPFVPDFEKII